MFCRTVIRTFLVAVTFTMLCLGGSAFAAEEFSSKPASKHTIEANRKAASRLPYSDTIAFEEQARGLIAAFGDHKAGQIREPFHAFLKDVDPEDYPDSVNPSIFRQAVMNYQAQGLKLSKHFKAI